MEIKLPKLLAYQQEVYDWLFDGGYFGSEKVAVIKSKRQSGKSLLCCVILIVVSFMRKGTSVLFEPTLEQSRFIYNTIVKAMQPANVIASCNAQSLVINFVNGSTILFKSTQQENSNRGYHADNILIIDEAAFLDDDAIFTILPLASVHKTPIIVCSSPFTMEGYFFDVFMLGMKGDNPKIKSFDWSHHPMIDTFLTEDRKKFYKQTMSKAKYQCEIDGDFLTDEGLLFNNLDACTKRVNEVNIAYIGIDFGSGTENDDTAISIINENGEQVAIYHRNNLSPMQQVDWISGIIKDLSERATISSVLAEKNSIGAVYIDALDLKLPKDVKITDWITSNKSKQDLVTNLQIALENQYISICPDDYCKNELRRYTQEINHKTKTITYNGKGAHDDCVIATMLSYKAYKDGGKPMYVKPRPNKTKRKSLAVKYG